MPFTDEERADWHRAKQKLEFRPEPRWIEPAAAVCIVCHQPFGFNAGMITEEVAICDVCNGD